MGLIDTLRRWTTGLTQTPHNTSRETIPPSRPSDLTARFGAESGRHATVRKAREMYDSDPRIQGMLRALARDATKRGFTVTVEDGPRAEDTRAVIDALVRRLRLKRKLDDWIRMTARDGDLFLELGVSAAREIVEVTRKPTLQMARLSDEFDRFPEPARAFAWTDQSNVASGSVGRDAVYFPEFLVLHARWNHDTEDRYGRPEFAAAVGTWKKVAEGEIDIAVTRKARAGVRYVHTLEGANEADFAAYKAQNHKALYGEQFPARADYFINGGRIDALQGDSNLGEIRDIEHHIQTMTAASPVPLELVAYGANLNRDVLQEKKDQYDEGIAATQAWAVDQIIEPLVERELLLAGILPESVSYSVGWPSKRVLQPRDIQALAAAVGQMRRDGWSDEAIWALIESWLPDDLTLDMLFDAEPEPAAPAVPPVPVDTASEDDADEDGDGEDEAGVAESTVPAWMLAESVGAVNRLIGRLEMVVEGDDDAY